MTIKNRLPCVWWRFLNDLDSGFDLFVAIKVRKWIKIVFGFFLRFTFHLSNFLT